MQSTWVWIPGDAPRCRPARRGEPASASTRGTCRRAESQPQHEDQLHHQREQGQDQAPPCPSQSTHRCPPRGLRSRNFRAAAGHCGSWTTHGVCACPRSIARMHSFSASRLLLISAPSCRVRTSSLIVSDAFSALHADRRGTNSVPTWFPRSLRGGGGMSRSRVTALTRRGRPAIACRTAHRWPRRVSTATNRQGAGGLTPSVVGHHLSGHRKHCIG